MSSPPIRRVTVLGSGMVGTSVALALRRAKIHVALSDQDRDSLAEALRMGAGVALTSDVPTADAVVIATPPSTVVSVLRDAQRRRLGTVYTDVASVKARICADARRVGCDLATYVPGHPIAGRELSGPAAARGALFAGRPWALCPYPVTSPELVRTVSDLVTVCGGVPAVLAPDVHDRIVATVSHAPHLVSAALAARFVGADETLLSLVGRGARDTTRVAAGAPALWQDILVQNAEPVAAVLEAVVRDLTAAVGALRGSHPAGSTALVDLFTRGNRGRERIVRAHPTG
ncbi:MAG TPA: prephenate dehydrogenase [Mycobacteriales bacterium]